MTTLCVNPASLEGGWGPLAAYFTNAPAMPDSSLPPNPWTNPPQAITTNFVALPRMISARCVSDENGSYLAVRVNGNPNDPRTDEITGDVVVAGQVQPDWGLHLIDMQLAMGDLVRIVAQESIAYRDHQAAIAPSGNAGN